MGQSQKSKEFMATSKGKVKVLSVKSIRKEGDSPPKPKEEYIPLTEEESAQFEYRLKDVRGLFLQCMAGIYLIAFLSIYLQADGLYGTNGVAPIKAELKLATQNPNQCVKEKFTMLCLIPGFFGIDTQHALDFVLLLGIVVSAVASLCVYMCTLPIFIFLWAMYFSVYQVGNVYLWFQWDILLLEAGILAIIASPLLPTKGQHGNKPRDLVTMWMVKWLLFRLMFASGIVKLQSGCPTWWGLSALNYHFESQCIPTPASYFAHHLPAWLLKLGVVGTYYIEIAVPIGFFAPFKFVRRYAFYLQILFQLAIIATGNYTFFNLLTMVLCVSLLDAEWFGHRSPQPNGFSASRLFSRSFALTLIGFSLFYTYKYFGLSINPDNTIGSKITFSRVDFDWFVSISVPYAAVMGLLTLGSTCAQALIISLFDMKGCWKKFTSFVAVVFYSALCLGLFSLTLVPFTSLHKETNRGIWPAVRDTYQDLQRYHIANSYGLFRRMTGVENGRPEVILEYSDDVQGPWKEYQWMYKPGNISAAPVFVLPHQPRLDWQVWFAALGTYHDNPWLVSLTYRLLQGEKSVIKLLDESKAPAKPPKYIRGILYHYSFTKPNSAGATKGEWWSRKKDKEYIPIFSKDHPPLVEFVKGLGYLEPDYKIPEPNKVLTMSLDKVRESVAGYRPEYLMWGSIIAILAIIFTSKLFKN